LQKHLASAVESVKSLCIPKNIIHFHIKSIFMLKTNGLERATLKTIAELIYYREQAVGEIKPDVIFRLISDKTGFPPVSNSLLKEMLEEDFNILSPFVFACYTGLPIDMVLVLRYKDLRKVDLYRFEDGVMALAHIPVPLGEDDDLIFTESALPGIESLLSCYADEFPSEGTVIDQAFSTFLYKMVFEENASFEVITGVLSSQLAE